ncbi:ribonuclease P protein component [Algoriphagus machipongonensis]|uniref:Ribonuclease P protein component n=1 Tax=Algoriphagus machipongonensis TaxID=388413 RepID=A3HX70_9BACT|nr:ribonuclease P protein component [Algoriphagus machipongonensis]EAZ81193.1 ribonuclease P [Algoriphagus machipongonensis]
MNYKLPKKERLYAEKEIKELFSEGSSFFLFPFKVQFFVKKHGEHGTPKVLFSVSKKKIKKAVDRNFVKRRMKESYRLNKSLLSGLENKELLLGLIYVGTKKMEFQQIQEKVILTLHKLVKTLEAKTPEHE